MLGGGDMEIKYQIFEDDNLLIQKFIGVFLIERYMKYLGYLMKALHTNMINEVLIDFRDVTFDATPEDFEDTVDKIMQHRKYLNENIIKRENVTIIFWVDNPLSTAIANLFQNNFSTMDYRYCSTLDSVNNILKLPEHFKNLEDVINTLENTF